MPHVDDKPKISIIMPAYNAQYTIAESIESVLRQTYLDFELIIINDNSTDDTTRIIQAYQIQDSRVILINNFLIKVPQVLGNQEYVIHKVSLLHF